MNFSMTFKFIEMNLYNNNDTEDQNQFNHFKNDFLPTNQR